MADGPMTLQDIEAEIAKRSGVDITDLPVKSAHVWVSKRTALDVQVLLDLVRSSPEWSRFNDKQKEERFNSLMAEMTPMLLQRRGMWPFGTNLIVEMFEDDAEVRVYALPTKGQDGKAPPVRYRLSKACSLPVYGAEIMSLETWMDAVAMEWTELDEDINVEEAAAEAATEQVIAYLKTLKEGYRIADLIADLKDGTHMEVEIEPEDEDDDGEPGDDDEVDDPDEQAAASEEREGETRNGQETEVATPPAGA